MENQGILEKKWYVQNILDKYKIEERKRLSNLHFAAGFLFWQP